MSFWQSFRKPDGFLGKLVLSMMNKGHKKISNFGFSHIEHSTDLEVLDAGCGGGYNLSMWLSHCPNSHVIGIDHSPLAVERSKKFNKLQIDEGKIQVLQANTTKLPFNDAQFDYVSAFETVYFWDIVPSFKEIYRVLKPNGSFIIANEAAGHNEKTFVYETKIQGMKIYNAETIITYLKQAGFNQFETDDDVSHDRLFIRAYKNSIDG